MCQVQGFRHPKLLTRKKSVLSILFWNLQFTRTNSWALQIFQEWQDQKVLKICTIEPGGLFKGEDIGVDVQELTASTEIPNAESLN